MQPYVGLFIFTFAKTDKSKLKLTFFIDQKHQQRLRAYIKKLQRFTIDLKGEKVRIYSHLSYKNGYLNIKFTHKIQLLKQEKASYTLLDFSVHKTLRSKYAKSLYELTSQFRLKGKATMKLDTIKQRLGLTKQIYRSAIQAVINPAIAEIQTKTGIKYTYLLSDKYFQITFAPPKKNLGTTPNFASSDRQKIYQTLREEGLSPRYALSMSANFTTKEIYEMKVRTKDKNPKIKIRSLPAYAFKISQYKQQSPKQICAN